MSYARTELYLLGIAVGFATGCIFIPFNRYSESMYEIWNILIHLITKIVLSFAIPLVVLLLMVAFMNYVIFSQSEDGSTDVWVALIRSYSIALGNFDFAEDHPNDLGNTQLYWISSIVLLLYTIVVVIIMMNLLVTILMNHYDEVQKAAKLSRCQVLCCDLFYKRILKKRKERMELMSKAGAAGEGATGSKGGLYRWRASRRSRFRTIRACGGWLRRWSGSRCGRRRRCAG